jgi:hypothetical protein
MGEKFGSHENRKLSKQLLQKPLGSWFPDSCF